MEDVLECDMVKHKTRRFGGLAFTRPWFVIIFTFSARGQFYNTFICIGSIPIQQ